MIPTAFYCLSSEIYFLGAVGLVNSLRLVGHYEPIFLVDCGLDARHRELLEPHVTVLDAPEDAPPYLLKTFAPRTHPAETMVLIDADMVVTRPLSPWIDRAARGGAVAVKDGLDRFLPEWGELLDLGPIEARPYVSSGLVCLGGDRGAEVLELWDDRMGRIDYERSYLAEDVAGYPLRYIDQDVLNAVLAARLEPGQVEVVDMALAPSPPFHGLRVRDAATLRVAHRDGTEPYLLHHYLRKPWLEPVYHSVYSRLLVRLLLGDDVAVRVPADEVPLRMREGFVARLDRSRASATDLTRWIVRDVIPEWVEARVAGLRRHDGDRS